MRKCSCFDFARLAASESLNARTGEWKGVGPSDVEFNISAYGRE